MLAYSLAAAGVASVVMTTTCWLLSPFKFGVNTSVAMVDPLTRVTLAPVLPSR